MTKKEFIAEISARSGLPRDQAAAVVETVLDTIQEVLRRGEEINFTGFGKFSVAERAARQGVNPQTGERIQISASRIPHFSAGAALRRAASPLPGDPDTEH